MIGVAKLTEEQSTTVAIAVNVLQDCIREALQEVTTQARSNDLLIILSTIESIAKSQQSAIRAYNDEGESN